MAFVLSIFLTAISTFYVGTVPGAVFVSADSGWAGE
jgi:hypothetical protein